MATAANIYANCLPQAFQGNLNVTGHTVKMALLSGYTPNLTADVHFTDVSAHEITGTGYSAGGTTLTSVSVTVTSANSWTHTWAAALAATYGQIIRPTVGNGFLYRCVQAGTTGGVEPTWPTVAGAAVTDSGAIWACVGDAAFVFSSATPTWAGATFSADHGVIYDSSTGVLICMEDFGATQSPAAQTFTVTPDPILGWAVFSPPS